MNTLSLKTLVAAVAASLLAAGAASAQIVGGGATLPENLYNGKAAPFNSGIITSITGFDKYIGVGSGNGKKAFFGDNSDFLTVKDAAGNDVPVYTPKVRVHYAGSDSLVTTTEYANYNSHATAGKTAFGPLVQIPVALTSVTVPFNVPGLNKLNLKSEELVKIFSGKVDNWKDVVVDIKDGVEIKGPDAPIKIVYRTGSSGTTEIFVRHLNATDNTLAPTVSSTFASAFTVTDATKYIPATGTSGVISTVRNTPYSISYVSPEVVDINSAAEVASIWNKDLAGADAYVLPTVNNVQAAVSSIAAPGYPPIHPKTSNPLVKDNPLDWGIGFNHTEAELAKPAKGYPITGVTNLILSQCYSNPLNVLRIKTFLNNNYSTTTAASTNDPKIIANNLVPLPANWQNAVHETFAKPTSTLAIGNTSVCASYAGR